MIIKTKATIEDYRKLPEGGKYQLIDGEIIEMPSPTVKHQTILVTLTAKLFLLISGTKSGILLAAPMDVHLGEENTCQPDILFIRNERNEIVKEDGVYGTPDFIIEILSPSTAYYDLKKKWQIYERAGVEEYFIIDPEDGEVIGYHLEEGRYREFCRENNKLRSRLLDLEITF